MLIQKRPLGTVAYLGGLPMVFEQFAFSLLQFALFNSEFVEPPGTYIHYDRTRASDHEHARNELVQNMRGEWLLQLDTDHVVSPDLLARMLRVATEYKAAVVTGFYVERNEPHVPTVYKRSGEFYGAIGEWERNEPMAVDAAGAGCLLVQKIVFDQIRQKLDELPFSKTKGLSEDLSFFHRLEKLGIPVLCDPRIAHHHLEVTPLTIADFDRDAVQLYMPEQVPTD